ncbi:MULTISPECIES: SDR family NAD(P)-dependent oxidoreductase [Phyllobacteriaceae]|uniref:SDR family NAD(P)-dependent oxidoreductase n=1 Tax=Phyllobacteriaceae TaxID=69277 RepID=UPI001301F770|nr:MULTISPECIES: SDR family NAD(P)-dependent oxidoreductase [Phyllobacteriaceae]WEX12250.1 SDR family NAD(P)-dependent oxidoreductase [Chelativorans sp. AA-79]
MTVQIDLKDKVVVVTGAAGGIGRAICARLAAAGASLLLTDLDQSGLERAAASLAGVPETQKASVGSHAADLGDPKVGHTLVEATLARFGRVDAVVNAGAVLRRTEFLDVEDAVLSESLNVNLASIFRICQAAVPVMLKAGTGAFVNFTSPSAFTGGRVGAVHYGAAKAGVITLTRGLAVQFGSEGIRANVLCPGTTATPMIIGALSDEQLGTHLRGVPMGRLAEPVEIANGVLFLLSDLASFVNGAVLTVDGGASLRP